MIQKLPILDLQSKGILIFYKGQEVKIMDARVANNDDKAAPSSFVEIGDSLKLKCFDGHAVVINLLYYMGSFCPAYCMEGLGFMTGDAFENAP